jgi:hypothetical protein
MFPCTEINLKNVAFNICVEKVPLFSKQMKYLVIWGHFELFRLNRLF